MANDLTTPTAASSLLKPEQTQQLTQATSALKAAKASKNEDAIDAAAKDFEAVFISEMLKPMFEGIDVDPTFGGGKGEEVFRGIMLQQYGKMISQTGQIGLADHVKQELLRIQEEKGKANAT